MGQLSCWQCPAYSLSSPPANGNPGADLLLARWTRPIGTPPTTATDGLLGVDALEGGSGSVVVQALNIFRLDRVGVVVVGCWLHALEWDMDDVEVSSLEAGWWWGSECLWRV